MRRIRMMGKDHIQWIALALLFFGQVVRADDAALIQKQFIGYHTRQTAAGTAVKRYMETQRPDGTWEDIDYTDRRRGSWHTLDHLTRVQAMAAAYADSGSQLHKSPDLKQAVTLGLDHWVGNDYRNPNWWYGRIGTPGIMGTAMVLMGSDLPEKTRRAAKPILQRSRMGMTGQNKVWCAGNNVMIGLVYDDFKLVAEAAEAIWSELTVTTEEGIQPDWSFHQHGPQQQFGNYGSAFGNDMVMWGTILQGTSCALSGEKLEILRNYLLEGPSWILWNGRMDLSGCGRQIDKGSQQAKARAINRQLERMIQIDAEYQDQYELRMIFSPQNKLTGFKPFWRSEMGVQRRPDWYASVKMSSTRVIGSETCNSENMRGLHLGDGVLLLHLTGREVEDIQPLWDWKRLPGTTCDQGVDDLEPKGSSNGYGGSDFAGVLGDGETGMAAMIYKRNELEARKAWFFEKDAVICLGAGIDGDSNGPVYTSIQQSWLKDPVVTSSGALANGTQVLKAGEWVHHAGFGYQLMDETVCMIKNVEGNWKPVFPTRGDRPASGNVFSLWVDHGASPNRQTYAYMVYPQLDASQMKDAVSAHQPKILSNTETLQAVETADGIQAVFYKRGQLTLGNGKKIKVSAPCLLSVRGNSLQVADPTHTRSSLTVTVGMKQRSVKLPAGEYAGQQVVVQ